VDFCQLHFAEKLTGVAVAAQAKLGRPTFLRRFRRATGFNLKEYLQYLRVDGAREKLEFSSLPLTRFPVWSVTKIQEPFGRCSRGLWGCRPESTVDPSELLTQNNKRELGTRPASGLYVYSEVFDLKPTSGLYPGSGALEYWSVVGGECLLYG
jgi:AraC-like DNA-binding protein